LRCILPARAVRLRECSSVTPELPDLPELLPSPLRAGCQSPLPRDALPARSLRDPVGSTFPTHKAATGRKLIHNGKNKTTNQENSKKRRSLGRRGFLGIFPHPSSLKATKQGGIFPCFCRESGSLCRV